MKSKFLLILFLLTVPAGRVYSQVPVTDVANLNHNTLNLIQMTSLVAKMFQDLRALTGNSERILPFLSRLEETIRRGQAISYGDPALSSKHQESFPGYQRQDGLYTEKNKRLVQVQLDTLRGVLESAKLQYENFELGQNVTDGVLGQSNASVGNLQALQSGNATEVLVVKQLAKLRQTLLARLNAKTIRKSAQISRRAEQEAKVASWAWQGSRRIVEAPVNDSRGIGKLSEVMNLR